MKSYEIPYNPKLKEYARELRNDSTKAEVLLWNELKRKQLGVQFYRQRPLDQFIVDFYCFKLRLAIEVDGPIHLFKIKDDLERQKILEEEYGITFLRFSNKAVYYNRFEVVETIRVKILELESL